MLPMLWVGGGVSTVLFVYLMVALLWPEKLS